MMIFDVMIPAPTPSFKGIKVWELVVVVVVLFYNCSTSELQPVIAMTSEPLLHDDNFNNTNQRLLCENILNSDPNVE